MTKTKRYLDAYAKVEARAAEGGKMYLDGLIPFNSDSEDLGGFIERIDPTAFNQTLSRGSNVYAFWAHCDEDVLASTDAGSLALSVDPVGLRFSVDLRPDCADKFAAVQRGDVVGVSFGFICQKEEWDASADPAIRTLKEVQLLEVSPGVAFPAYPGAQSAAALRSLEAERPHIAEMRTKYAKPAATTPDPLAPPPEQPPALESRKRAELAIIQARALLAQI